MGGVGAPGPGKNLRPYDGTETLTSEVVLKVKVPCLRVEPRDGSRGSGLTPEDGTLGA